MSEDSPKPKKSPPGDRIAKVLARAGVASRRDAEKMIAAGRVAVNGKIIDSPALNVTARDKVAVDGRPLDAPEPARLWLYHKPAGLVTTARDEQGRPTIFDELPENMPRVMSVGRLDLNSEGLLLLTNDGGLKRKLELPSTGWLRRYRVRVKGNPTDAMLEPLREGIVLDKEEFQPMQVVLDRQQGANAWLTVGLREGKNREIRRAMESIGLSVNRLIRISYGPFQLGPLPAGEVEEVRRRVLRDQLGLEAEDEPAKPRPTRQRGKPGSEGVARGRSGSPTGPGAGGKRGGKPGAGGPGAGAGARADARTGGKPAAGGGGSRTGGKPGAAAGGKPQTPGRGRGPAKDTPWGDGPRPKLSRRRPKKD